MLEQPFSLAPLALMLRELDVAILATTTATARASALVVQHQPSVFLLELDGQDDTGRRLTCLRRIRAQMPTLHAVVVGASSDRDRISATFAAGATAYVVKRPSRAIVSTALRAAIERPPLTLPRLRSAGGGAPRSSR